MNTVNQIIKKSEGDICSLFFTAGFPELLDTREILMSLDKENVDFIEVGMPYSDPLADGPTLQKSSAVALENGMSITILFEQLHDIRSKTQLPIVLMGYLNPVLQYGLEAFLKRCASLQIDGLILPDMPLSIYQSDYAVLFKKYQS